MKKILLFITLFYGFSNALYSQEVPENGVVSFSLPIRNSLKFNRYIINPTFSFVRESNPYVSFYNKRQWTQFDNAPQTYLFNYSGRFRENDAYAIGLFQQNYGLMTVFGGVVNFAHNIVLQEDSNLTFGLNVGAYQSGLDKGKIISDDTTILNGDYPSNTLLTVNPGINYGTAFLDFGLSVNNLILYNFGSGMVKDDPERAIELHAMYTGYIDSFGFFDGSKFSGIVKTEIKQEKTILSGLAMITIPQGVWAQAGYNTLYGVSAGLGVNISPSIAIEYNYERGMGNFANLGGSHEFVIAYRFKNKSYYYGDDEEGSLIDPSKPKPVMAKPSTAPVTRVDGASKALLAAEAKAKADAEAKQARLAAAEKVKADAEAARVKLLADNKAKADAAEAQKLKLAAEAKAKADAESTAKAKTAVVNKPVPQKTQAQLAADKAKADAEAAAKAKAAVSKPAPQKTQAQLAADKAKADAEAAAKAKAAANKPAPQKTPTQLAADKVKADAEAAKAKLAADAKAKADAEAAKVKLAADTKAKADAAEAKRKADAKAKAEAADLQSILAADAKAKADSDAYQAKLAADAKAKAAAEAKTKASIDAANKAKLDAAAKAKAAEEAALKEKLAADAKAKADAEARQALIAAEAKAKADAEAAKLKLAADAKAKADAEAQAKLAADAKAKADAEAQQAKIAADAKAKADAEAQQAKLAADAKAKADMEALQAKLLADARVKADAEATAKAKADAEAKQLQLAEEARQAKLAADAKAKADAEALQAKLAADTKAKADAEALKAKQAADAKVKADEEARQAKLAADAKAKADAEALQAKLAADAKAKADMEALQAKLLADAKVKADAEATAKAKADAEAKQLQLAEEARQAKLAADAKAKADAEALQAKLAADAKAKADADALKAKQAADAKAKADEEARQAKLAADAKAKADAEALQAKLAADAKAKADADALKIKLAADAKAKADAEALLAKQAAEAKLKADEEARQAKLAADAKAKADAEALQARLAEDAELKAKLAADAKAKADADAAAKLAAAPKDDSAKEIEALSKAIEAAIKSQKEVFAQFTATVANKQKDLDDLREENDLSEKGVYREPKPFKSVASENSQLEAFKLQLAEANKNSKDELNKLTNLYNERLRKVPNKNDALNKAYLEKINELKAAQLKMEQDSAALLANLERIKAETEIEKKRRIKRAAYENDQGRYTQDLAALKRIKETTKLSSTPLTASDFDFGEDQSNMQIIKNIKNSDNGYYMIIAVHSSVQKRDEFLTKAVAAGRSDINFFYNIATSKYYIYYEKFDGLPEATKALEAKGNKPYNGKMAIVKVEN
ncbi:PorP/SprF family type IX secretion system membrane protein [Flavobacterium aquidurense]|uniref:PorP/SprF family type IX secretion system membrane protein n=1 Tax=Flavobacterium aquidurense TaxID=362413 RepID=UPI0028653F87|nr:PorP/SprF family type IX secretion system membrane protein [Flavobacterium aquidurense]MDR7369843.1 type IX secretion system PorP/SprF family membrane protein [Flavobacterium aquidurense]